MTLCHISPIFITVDVLIESPKLLGIESNLVSCQFLKRDFAFRTNPKTFFPLNEILKPQNNPPSHNHVLLRRRQVRPPLLCGANHRGLEARLRRQTQTSLLTISHPQTNPKPLGSSHFQVARGVELLRGDDASVPHSHSLCIAHFDALRLSALLRLDLRRGVMLDDHGWKYCQDLKSGKTRLDEDQASDME
ncbi:uncharacterized protein [Malus domestica]|uniref:uncharacterized protein n=1 Tax=Malus domestica TaxID=3750 RepID=UPI00397471E3